MSVCCEICVRKEELVAEGGGGESIDSSLKSFNGKLRGADLLVIQSPLEAGQSWGLPFKADLPLNGKN